MILGIWIIYSTWSKCPNLLIELGNLPYAVNTMDRNVIDLFLFE